MTQLTVSYETTTFEWASKTITAIRFGKVVSLYGHVTTNKEMIIPEGLRPAKTVQITIYSTTIMFGANGVVTTNSGIDFAVTYVIA